MHPRHATTLPALTAWIRDCIDGHTPTEVAEWVLRAIIITAATAATAGILTTISALVM